MLLVRRVATRHHALGRSLLSTKVVITARPFPQTISRLEEVADSVAWNNAIEPWTDDELHRHGANADALLCFMTDSVDRSLLNACPNLRVIACALKGFDNFDVDECRRRGVAVTAVPDLLTAPTAELAIALALGLGRRLREGDALVRGRLFRGWRPTLYGNGLAGTSVGILGYGAVGRAVAMRLTGFETQQLRYYDVTNALGSSDPTTGASPVSLDELVASSEVLFVCTPLTPCTRHMIDATLLSRMKPGCLLINVSRGSCVSEAAVADALEAGALGGYAADVFEFEDWALAARPEAVEPRLCSHERTLLTPHLGSAVGNVRLQIELAAAEEIVRHLRGEPLRHRVNRS